MGSVSIELGRSVRSLGSVSLAEMTAAASLLTRIDRKYVVGPEQLDRILDGSGSELRALDIDGERHFTYESVYFDTPELESYRRAARERPDRFKVRTRSYVDAGSCMLEVKVPGGRGQTVKSRMGYSPQDWQLLTDDGQAFVAEYVDLPRAGRELVPTLTTRYHRATLLDGVTRITIDADLVCTRWDGAELKLPESLIVETKSAGSVTRIDRLFWAAGLRPVSISKYAAGMAGLDPSLPANKWNQVLRRHFGWTPAHPTSRAVSGPG